MVTYMSGTEEIGQGAVDVVDEVGEDFDEYLRRECIDGRDRIL